MAFILAISFSTLSINAKVHKRVTNNIHIIDKSLNQAIVFKSTGKNAIYTKPNGIKGSRLLVSKHNMQKKTNSNNTNDYFMAYQTVMNNKGYHYYKVVSFDKKIRGYVFNKGIVKTNVGLKTEMPKDRIGMLIKNRLFDAAYGSKFGVKLNHYRNIYNSKFTIIDAVKVTSITYYNVYNNNNHSMNGWINAKYFKTDERKIIDTSGNNFNIQPQVTLENSLNKIITNNEADGSTNENIDKTSNNSGNNHENKSNNAINDDANEMNKDADNNHEDNSKNNGKNSIDDNMEKLPNEKIEEDLDNRSEEGTVEPTHDKVDIDKNEKNQSKEENKDDTINAFKSFASNNHLSDKQAKKMLKKVKQFSDKVIYKIKDTTKGYSYNADSRMIEYNHQTVTTDNHGKYKKYEVYSTMYNNIYNDTSTKLLIDQDKNSLIIPTLE